MKALEDKGSWVMLVDLVPVSTTESGQVAPKSGPFFTPPDKKLSEALIRDLPDLPDHMEWAYFDGITYGKEWVTGKKFKYEGDGWHVATLQQKMQVMLNYQSGTTLYCNFTNVS